MQRLSKLSQGSGGIPVGSSKNLCLLALDGGGVRGLSTLHIIKQLMESIDPMDPPKPCDYFDMIGGTSTGGLIALMLGRLEMSIDEAIQAYIDLSPKIFTKLHHSLTLKGRVQGRFDHNAIENGVKAMLMARDISEDTLLKNPSNSACKTFVCATSKQTGSTVVLSSYFSKRRGTDLLVKTKIWEAARATSAASSFFDPITIGNEGFVDGATPANNPISEMWTEANDAFKEQEDWKLEDNVSCLVSIGTGIPSINPFGNDPVGIGKALLAIATDTEKKAEDFHKHHSQMAKQGRYFRFNVVRGLESVGLEDASKVDTILSATRLYIQTETVFNQMEACAKILSERETLYLVIESAQLYTTHAKAYFDSLLRLEEVTAAATPGSTSLIWFKNTSGYRRWLEKAGTILWYPVTPRSESLQHGNLAACVAYDLLQQETKLSKTVKKMIYFRCSTDMLLDVHIVAKCQRLTSADDIEMSLVLKSILAQVIINCEDIERKIRFLQRLDQTLLKQVFVERKGLDVNEFILLLQSLLPLLLTRNQELVIVLDEIHCVEASAAANFFEKVGPLLSSWTNVRLLVTGSPNGVIGDGSTSFVKVDEDSECNDCLDSLKLETVMFTRRDQISLAEEGTNEWIWSHPVYKDWEWASSGILWIQGKAGSGKSVLAKTICTRLSQQPGTQSNFSTAQQYVVTRSNFLTGEFFYSRRAGMLGISHESMFRSILYQLLEKDRTLFEYYQDNYRRRNWQQKMSHFLLDILSRISDAKNKYSRIICVIDALDESRQRNDTPDISGLFMEEVIEIFKSIVKGNCTRVKFVVLSRPSKTIETSFKRCDNLHYIILENANKGDIATIVDASLRSLQKAIDSLDSSDDELELRPRNLSLTSRRKQAASLRCRAKRQGQDRFFKQGRDSEAERLRKIGDYIKEHANGVILWVNFIIKELTRLVKKRFYKDEELRELLETLPLELTGMYSQMVENLSQSNTASDLAKAKQILVWIMGASETKLLTLEELWDALATPLDVQSALRSKEDPIVHNRIRFGTKQNKWSHFRRSLHEFCGSFIEVIAPVSYLTGSGWGDSLYTEPSFIVQLIHQTAKDFLQDPRAKGFYISLQALQKVDEVKLQYLSLALPLVPTNFVPSLEKIKWKSIQSLTEPSLGFGERHQTPKELIEASKDEDSWTKIIEETALYMEEKLFLNYVISTSQFSDDYKRHFRKLGIRYASSRRQFSDEYERFITNKEEALGDTLDWWLYKLLRKQEYVPTNIIESAEYTAGGRYFGFAFREYLPHAVQNMLDIVSSIPGWWKHNEDAVLNSVLVAAIDLGDLAAVKALTEGQRIRRTIKAYEPLIRMAVSTGNRPVIFYLYEIANEPDEDENEDAPRARPRSGHSVPEGFDFDCWGLSPEDLQVDQDFDEVKGDIELEALREADDINEKETDEVIEKIVGYWKAQEAALEPAPDDNGETKKSMFVGEGTWVG